MDPTDPNHRRNRSSPLQSIPLRDLHRPPDNHEYEGQGRAEHRRTLSDRGRDLLRNRESLTARTSWGSRYAPIIERSPSPTMRRNGESSRSIASPPLQTSFQHSHHEAADISPIDDVGGFQAAIGFAGLSFQGETQRESSPWIAPYGDGSRDSSQSLTTPGTIVNTPATNDVEDQQGYFSPSYSDTAPLTNSRNLQPISGAEHSTPVGQRHHRTSFQSVRFLTPEGPSPSARFGDSLHVAEIGATEPQHNRRGSASSPLHRAGTIVRNMSQRVVNLSNEPELAERSIRRKSSVKPYRRQERQSVPEEPEFGHDGTYGSESPVEKLTAPPEFPAGTGWKYQNPLRGKSLGIFSADNRLRQKLCDLLVHPATEPVLLVLIIIQTVLLTVDAASDVVDHPRPKRFWDSWINWGLLVLFIIYTIEIIIRVIVSGFIINPVEYSTINRQLSIRQAVIQKAQSILAPERQPSVKRTDTTFGPSIIRTFTTNQIYPDISGDSRQQQRARLAHRAFLRHSFNRLDFLAVVSFWISFCISVFGVEHSRHAYVFRMLSCLRILRLLSLTSGTTVILRSLKKAAPLLVNVAFLISFFWLLFAIIGFCGGYLDKEGNKMPWLKADGQNGTSKHKGFLCPQNSLCVEGDNPYNGTVSFDNIFQSLELVFVLMSSNTFSDLMYYLTDSEYLAASLFFAAGIVIMTLWLINLLIAVITSSFQVIREESKASAFTAEEDVPQLDEENDLEMESQRKKDTLKEFYDKTFWVWIVVIAYGLVCQALRSASMSDSRERFINGSETVVTLILVLDIGSRMVAYRRDFFRSKQNMVDLAIAVITAIMQIPKIHNSGQAYQWLTIFQIMRIYRVVLAVSLTRDLIMIVLGNVTGLLNLILFVFLLTFLAAIFAAQMFRGEIPPVNADGETIQVTFATIYNSFLGMYQVLSSENWTEILYNVTTFDVRHNTGWMGAAFFILWYILANFIVLNMFIAVIQENFDVSEDEKRLQQVKAFLQQKELGGSSHGNLSLSSIFKLGQASARRRDPLDYGSAATEMLLKDAVVRDFLDDQNEQPLETPSHDEPHLGLRHQPTMVVSAGWISSLWERALSLVRNKEPNPFYSRLEFSKAYQDLDPRLMAKEVVAATERRKIAQREYLRKHKSYNVSLFIFAPDNRIRKLCQRIVGAGRGGERIEGVAPSTPVWYAFSAFIYAAIVAMVLLACVTTPLYQKEYFENHKFSVKNWFVFTDMGFAILFTIEATIKVIADGFFWTPNAYFRGSWGFIDGIVLVTLWINVGTSLVNEGAISRAVGAFKALRALRLLNVSDSARETFHSVIVKGMWKVISAAFVSLSLLVPFAIYGLNLFNGRMKFCNDDGSGIFDLNDCVGEYVSTPFGWEVLAPRTVSNPYFDFDNFGGSLFILFQIVSQEGWTDVMWAAESITGVFKQPRPFASQGNAVFFIAFNLLGAVFVLTLFVSVFMRNYTEQTGVAYLTTDQRSWLELRKLLRQISPSKRPSSSKKRETWEEWCYKRAVRKTGRWQRFITGVLILHLVLLCVEYYPGNFYWERSRDYVFLLLTMIYVANIVVRIIGLTWTRFRKSSWDVYSIFAISGTLITTVLLLSNFRQRLYVQIHKLCLVSIALLLIPRNNQLDQLFKTAAASLSAIGNLMATWFVLFLVYAIALTQTFGLTRFNANENGNINFRTVPKALILLFRTSIGEGWNQIMEDFATVTPPLCVADGKIIRGDCGSPEWARAIFISWNILSMYIFVNLFVSLIYESFSYVYQRSSGLSVISREEIRRFKQAWAEFDPDGTGFILKDKFPRLLGELSGIFEMRIYDGDFTVRRIIEDCSASKRTSELPLDNHTEVTELDLKKLNRRLRELPIKEIRRRRARMNQFYEEVLVSADPDKGISFNALLMILAHYKVINDNKSLRLEEFLRRRARLQRVQEAVHRNVVIGFFDTLYWNRRFRRIQEGKNAGRMTAIPTFTVPEIFVDDEDITSGGAQVDDPFSPSLMFSPVDLSGRSRSVSPPSTHMRSRSNSVQITPNASPTQSTFPASDDQSEWQLAEALGSRPPSPLEASGPSLEPGTRSRQNSSVSAQDVLEVLDNSAWGESIRRSFTQRRPPSGRP
ncbi:calcium channel-like protein subunit Cch1 [Patellaria atrata CBS 101060]|uniref:Calcium-channel protein CCH1 n=1 Tax=Patellaria atrata CBS 101060 TaxID=1346257 RepID=A0A9P4SGV3_9PEZI|nr:calcium channel-like protein subunit Cch1 [Patellaria atrata CBS 101060]